MSSEERKPITRVLQAVAQGDSEAGRDLLPLVYDELRNLARARLAHEAPGQTLQPTALVHEAYLRVSKNEDLAWDCRGHFFAAAARAMRQILVENARRKTAQKRGGGHVRQPADSLEPALEPPSEDVLAVDEAVKRLEREDPRKGQIVNLRFFARMTTAETAAALGVSVGTVRREWRYIRAWLQAHLTEHEGA
ncbi:MAG: sigma-70 family RNA polymerase sigma factor [Phycisphaerales bacterium]|nr:MAG: sigma-70 family RNA polymerase sigma factor [Phycisphaerales bacterium]